MTNRQILISIIVPIYNVEKYVEKCILSIISQTYKNLQIILIDDGSTDKSGEICDRYAKIDARIQVIHQQNEGLVRARKEGLKRAKGQYIGFVDGDDYIDENMYDAMLNDILLSHADFIHTAFFKGNGDIIRFELNHVDKIYDIRNRKIQFLRDYVIEQNDGISYSIWSKLFKRELIIKCYQKVPDDQSYGEDMLALCACIMESNYIYISKRAYYHYVLRNDSMTHQDWAITVSRLGKLYGYLQNLLKEYNSYDELKESLDRWFQICIVNRISSVKTVRFSIHRYFYSDILSLKGKSIAVYGAGTVGQDYYSQICQYQKCKVVAWVDKNAFKYKNDCAEVSEPERLKEIEYDILIIAVKDYELAEQIKKELIEQGISENKITWSTPQYLS